jgi:hypothetical protein
MKLGRIASSLLAIMLVLGLATFGARSGQVGASSHREAPMISDDPAADNTDVYAFVSPDKPDTVTFVLSFWPFEEPVGGPNYFKFDPSVLYELHIDNVGDAKSHITYQFRFNTKVGNGNTFLYNTGPIESIDSANWNVKQFYSVTRLDDGKAAVLGENLKTPPVNIGPPSTPNYEALSNAAISSLSDGSMVFAGQSDDPFFVDLNVFNLLQVRKLPGNAGGGVDGLKGYNVQTIALQVPMSRLSKSGAKPSGPGDASAVIGVWSTTSRQATRVLKGDGTMTGSGDFVQISRLGSPLVNEVVAPLGAKDLFNSSKPENDAQFLPAVLDPETAKLLNAIYKVQVPPAPRDDLVAIFLTGIPGATQPPTATLKPSEQLRLNMGVPVSAQPNSLGVVAGDLGGFPNGRRLADDVTDVALKAVAGAAYPLFHPEFKADPLAAQLGDGVDANDAPFRASFPYVALPWSGLESVPHGVDAPVCPPAAPCPPAGGGNPPTGGGQMPGGMPTTGSSGLFNIDHLGDIYGYVLGGIAVLGGLTLLGGWAIRRRADEKQ